MIPVGSAKLTRGAGTSMSLLRICSSSCHPTSAYLNTLGLVSWLLALHTVLVFVEIAFLRPHLPR
ncbi:hypothetical protein BDW74DRAFT_144092 [Aspergillus multicolor]|uniref:uncharacterized protein n=1 Tax=Aspergillus multicolor TaxID=41759 RepID=UPI003CCE4EF9